MSLGIFLSLAANTGMNLGTNVIKSAHNKRLGQHKELTERNEAKERAAKEERRARKTLARISRAGSAAGPVAEAVEGAASPEEEAGGSGPRKRRKKKKKRKKERVKLKPIYKSKTWVLGFALFKICNWTNFAAYGFGSQSVLSAIASVQFVSNLVFSYFFLGERPTPRMVLGTLTIVLGIVVVIICSYTEDSQDYIYYDLLALYRSPAYIGYIVCLLSLGAGAFAFHQKLVREEAAKLPAPGGQKEPESILKPLSYSLYSAILGTQSVGFSKMFMEMIQATAKGNNQEKYIMTWVFLLGLIVCGIYWDKQLNQGLRLYDALVIVPMMQSLWTILCIINGGVYFQEFQQLSPMNGGLFAMGVFIVMLGMMSVMPSADFDEVYETLMHQPGQGWDLGRGPEPAAAAGDGSKLSKWKRAGAAAKFIARLDSAKEAGRKSILKVTTNPLAAGGGRRTSMGVRFADEAGPAAAANGHPGGAAPRRPPSARHSVANPLAIELTELPSPSSSYSSPAGHPGSDSQTASETSGDVSFRKLDQFLAGKRRQEEAAGAAAGGGPPRPPTPGRVLAKQKSRSMFVGAPPPASGQPGLPNAAVAWAPPRFLQGLAFDLFNSSEVGGRTGGRGTRGREVAPLQDRTHRTDAPPRSFPPPLRHTRTSSGARGRRGCGRVSSRAGR